MSRSSSGSVPSMAMVTPLTRNGSLIEGSDSSKESRPSRRARSARLTTSGIIAPAGSTLPPNAIFSELGMALASSMVPPAMLTSIVVPNTRSSGGMRMRLIGLPPSITLAAMTTVNPPMIPIAGAGSISDLPVRDAVRRQGRDRGQMARRGWFGLHGSVRDLLVGQVRADGDDRAAVLADGVDDLLERLLDDVLLAV